MVYTPKTTSREFIDLSGDSQKEGAAERLFNATPCNMFEHCKSNGTTPDDRIIEDRRLQPLCNTPSPATTHCYDDPHTSSLSDSKTVVLLPSHIATLQKIENLLVENNVDAAEARSLLSSLLDELKRNELKW
eukprot:10411017-Lingulodinium_polyedra.AAC.1